MKMGVAIKMGRLLGKRVGGSACWRMGDEVYDALETPIRRHVSPSRRLSEEVRGVKDDEDCGCGSAAVDHCQRFRLTPRVPRI